MPKRVHGSGKDLSAAVRDHSRLAAGALVLAIGVLAGCGSKIDPHGYANVASLDVCATLDAARLATLIGGPARLESQPAVAESGLAGSCRVTDSAGKDQLLVSVWTDASVSAPRIAPHATAVFDRMVQVDFDERVASGNPVARRELAPENGKAVLLVPTGESRDPAGAFMGVDRGVLVSINSYAGLAPDPLGELGLELMQKLKQGSRASR